MSSYPGDERLAAEQNSAGNEYLPVRCARPGCSEQRTAAVHDVLSRNPQIRLAAHPFVEKEGQHAYRRGFAAGREEASREAVADTEQLQQSAYRRGFAAGREQGRYETERTTLIGADVNFGTPLDEVEETSFLSTLFSGGRLVWVVLAAGVTLLLVLWHRT